MREYQVVIAKLQNRVREDEDALTDLLNERARAGWTYESAVPLSAQRLLLVFGREA